MEAMNQFTKAEAEAKVGKRVRTTIDRPGYDKGTLGTVIAADEMPGGFYLRIIWDDTEGTTWYSKEAFETTLEEV